MTLAASYGLKADDWQADPVRCIFARRKNGRWASATTKISVPRQNGKNGILEIVELFGMVVLGMKFLHTAHEVKTARKAFRRILSFFENERQFPELAAMAVEIRKTNGQEAIFLSNGGSIEFIARSSGSGRGFTVDALVCDEDQDLTDEELAALLPTISAAPSGNPMVILTGTPPPLEKLNAAQGEVARRVRQDGLNRTDPNLTCFDWGAPDGPMPDVNDEDLAYQYNPALGGRLNIEEVRRERKMMSPEKFAQERYGWWGNPQAARRGVIPMDRWRGLKVEADEPRKGLVVVDVSPDLEWATIAVASDHSGRALVLVDRHETSWDPKAAGETPDDDVEQLLGSDAVIAGVTKLVTDLEVVEVALTPTAKLLSAKLTKAGVEHKILTNTEVGLGCTTFQDMVRGDRAAHVGQIELDDAVRNAITRYVGDTQHWDRRDRTVDISALVAGSTAAQRWELAMAAPQAPPPPPVRAQARPNTVAQMGF